MDRFFKEEEEECDSEYLEEEIEDYDSQESDSDSSASEQGKVALGSAVKLGDGSKDGLGPYEDAAKKSNYGDLRKKKEDDLINRISEHNVSHTG